jgi:hypothetical protein
MLTKSSLSLLTAAAALCLGTAYAAGYESDPTGSGASPSTTPRPAEESTPKPLTKEEALSRGVPETVFNKADTDKNGVLDPQEIVAYNEKASKQR